MKSMTISLPNTADGGIPSNPMPDSALIQAEDRESHVDHALAAKRQARRAEGFRTSEKLERIDKEDSELATLREQKDAELNQASADYVDGKKGAGARVTKLNEELQAIDAKQEALRRGRLVEGQRLEEEYTDQVERAQQAFLERIDDAASAAYDRLEYAEGLVAALGPALDEAEKAMRLVAAYSHSEMVGRQLSSTILAMLHHVGVRLDIHGDGGPGDSRGVPLTVHAPNAEDAKRRAEVPEHLEDLPTPAPSADDAKE